MYEYSLSLYEKAMPDFWGLEQKLSAAKDCGYDSIEICIDAHPDRAARLDWDKEQFKALWDFLLEREMHIPTVSLSLLRSCPLGMLDDAVNWRALELVKKCAAFCCRIGAQVMLINGYDVYDSPSTPETQARFAENLSKAVAIAARLGVILAMENAEMPFVDSIAKAAAWTRRIDSPYFCIYGDVGNSFNAMGGDTTRVLEDLEAGRGKLAAFHLKDSLPGQYRYVPYGEGHVDFATAVPKLRELGVRLFTAEQFWQPQQQDWQAEAVRINRFLRSFF